MAETLSDEQLLQELEPVAEQLLARHLKTSKPWYPHTYIPYGRAEDFPDDYEWSEEMSPVKDPDVRSALVVNLLTEDNLPYYFRDIDRMFAHDGVWNAWNGRWTAEEGRHSMAIYGYLMASRLIDPVALEDARMVQVSKGEVPHPQSARRGFIYVTLQELATRISHRNTGDKLADTDVVGKRVMDRVGNDENLHHLFYRDASDEAKLLDPSGFVEDTEAVVTDFNMPGTGIPGFAKHATRIALSGIYGKTEFLERVVNPVLNKWDIWKLEGLNGKAEAARERLSVHLQGLGEKVKREKEKREARKAQLAEQAV